MTPPINRRRRRYSKISVILFGAPDIVVCNAGITADTLLIRMKDEDWERVIQTNLSAVFRLARIAVAAMMKKRFGRLIGVSSVVARMGNAGQANYCASKAGMEGFFRAVAKEVAARGVTVNTVAPGFIDTDMTKNLPDTWKEFLIAQTPAKRMAPPKKWRPPCYFWHPLPLLILRDIRFMSTAA